MKKSHLYILSFFGIFCILGACAEGDVSEPNDDDLLAQSRVLDISDEDVANIVGNCQGNKECISNILVVYGPMSSYNPFLSSSSNPWGGYSSELPIIQYSSSWDSLASLSSSSELILSSFEFFESSSSIIDIVSSSSNFVFEYSSSENYPIYSSSDIFPWSSSSDVNPPISSSSELLLSSETALSSEIALSSAMLSSSAEALPISGHCQAEKSTVPLGGSVRWTYVPDSGTRVTGMFVWQDLFSVEMEQEGEGLSSVTFTYPVGGPNVGEVVYPTTLKFDGVDIDCSSNAVRITAPENNLSSSSEFIPENSSGDIYVPNTSASNPGMSSGCFVFDQNGQCKD